MRLTGLEPPYTLTPYYRCTLNWQIPRFAQGYKSESREKEIVQIRLNSVQDYQEVEGNDTEYLKEKWEKESNIVMHMDLLCPGESSGSKDFSGSKYILLEILW